MADVCCHLFTTAATITNIDVAATAFRLLLSVPAALTAFGFDWQLKQPLPFARGSFDRLTFDLWWS